MPAESNPSLYACKLALWNLLSKNHGKVVQAASLQLVARAACRERIRTLTGAAAAVVTVDRGNGCPNAAN